MYYAALGDSISIDDYTQVPGGGAASQLARLLPASRFANLTRDGNVTTAVLIDMDRIEGRPDLVTLTAGGNDLLMGRDAEAILHTLEQIAARLDRLGARVILNTVYDPSDGDDRVGEQAGLDRELRGRFNRVNAGIRAIADRHGFLLCDLEALFHGHGIASTDPWFVMDIEPNLAGATAIAEAWRRLAVGERVSG